MILNKKSSVFAPDIKRLDFELINNSAAETSLEKICLHCFEPDGANGVRFLRMGLNMPGDPACFLRLSREKGFEFEQSYHEERYLQQNDDDIIFDSNTLIAWKPDDSDIITMAAPLSFKYSEGVFDVHFRRSDGGCPISFSSIFDSMTLASGEKLIPDPLLIFKGTDLNAMLREWAKITAAQVGGPRIPERTPSGWNDWQFYRNEKTAEDVLDSAQVIADLKKRGYPLDFVQIDGGFCMHLSEWSKPKEGFSIGIKKLSESIRAQGLKFGLWFAPYIQNINTNVAKEHPEWFLRDADGQLVENADSNVGASRLIDFSIPGAELWLREQLRLFIDDWKVQWIKLDGPTYKFYRRGILHDRKISISQMLRRTFEIIREEAGENVLVEGEGMMSLALGMVDLQRVQTDNHPKWYQGSDAYRPYAPRVYGKELLMGFLHNNWWCNHRENVILRSYPSPLSHSAITGNGCEQVFTENELRTQLAAAAMGSGGILLTDPMRQLLSEPERLKYAARLLPVAPEAAEMIDTFPDAPFPTAYHLNFPTHHILGLFNWRDEIRDFEYDIEMIAKEAQKNAFYAFSFFGGRCLGLFEDRIKIKNLGARAADIIALRPRQDHPQVISTDIHFLQGLHELKAERWDEKSKTLTLTIEHFELNDARIFLAANSYRILEVSSSAERYSFDDFDPNFPVIRCGSDSKKIEIKVRFK